MIPLDDNIARVGRTPVALALVFSNVAVHLVLHECAAPMMSQVYWDYGFRSEQMSRLLHGGVTLAEAGLFLRSLVGSAFLHVGWAHLLVNMAFLYRLGTAVECQLGSRRFAVLYAVSACAALSLHSLVILRCSPEMAGIPLVGASGAISGVLAAYVLLFPGARVILVGLFLILPLMLHLPVWLAAGLWVALQVWMGRLALVSADPEIVLVAWWAHLGGCAGGVVCTAVFRVAARLRRRLVSGFGD